MSAMDKLSKILREHPAPWHKAPSDLNAVWIEFVDANGKPVEWDDPNSMQDCIIEAVNIAAQRGH
jgi:hypothetical protein